jgi:hypothetical protein
MEEINNSRQTNVTLQQKCHEQAYEMQALRK